MKINMHLRRNNNAKVADKKGGKFFAKQQIDTLGTESGNGMLKSTCIRALASEL